jgi:hypothetical protein
LRAGRSCGRDALAGACYLLSFRTARGQGFGLEVGPHNTSFRLLGRSQACPLSHHGVVARATLPRTLRPGDRTSARGWGHQYLPPPTCLVLHRRCVSVSSVAQPLWRLSCFSTLVGLLSARATSMPFFSPLIGVSSDRRGPLFSQGMGPTNSSPWWGGLPHQ